MGIKFGCGVQGGLAKESEGYWAGVFTTNIKSTNRGHATEEDNKGINFQQKMPARPYKNRLGPKTKWQKKAPQNMQRFIREGVESPGEEKTIKKFICR